MTRGPEAVRSHLRHHGRRQLGYCRKAVFSANLAVSLCNAMHSGPALRQQSVGVAGDHQFFIGPDQEGPDAGTVG